MATKKSFTSKKWDVYVTYYHNYERQTYEYPGCDEIEIESIERKGVDVFDIFDDNKMSDLEEEARENENDTYYDRD